MRSPHYPLFLRELRRLRTEAGLTQADAAQKLSKTQSYISKVELGERRLDVVELIELCHAYELSPSAFVERLHLLMLLASRKL